MTNSKSVAVVDFGSSKISVMCGERAVNDTYNIKASADVEYAGFNGGEFYEPSQVLNCLKSAISAVETNLRSRIKKIYVGVPGEFITTVIRETEMDYKRKTKITEDNVDQLFESANVFDDNRDYTVIKKAAIYFETDGEKRVVSPVGLKVSKIKAICSFVLCEKKFLVFIIKLLNSLGIKEYDFVSSTLATTRFLFTEKEREGIVLLCDIGYITTSLMIASGKGFLFTKSFADGGGYIAADLSECLHIPYSVASKLKDQIALSLEITKDDKYEIKVGEEKFIYDASIVHQIVKDRLTVISTYIKKIISESPYSIDPDLTLYITGGGISYMRGSCDFLSSKLGRPVEVAVSNRLSGNKPHRNSIYAVLDVALTREEKAAKKFKFNS